LRPFLENLQQPETLSQRPLSRRVAELLPEIEESIRRGFTRDQIVRALKAEGIEISPSTLSTYLLRLRRRRPNAGTTEPAPVVAKAELQLPAPSPTAPPAPGPSSGFQPGDIAAIARSEPDLKELRRLGREFAAKRATEKG
jgi:hypothetical protein